jgi:hypothetical protein
MSKVKIQGNASGTGVVTLTAPNTNTDRTITLPDDTQTLIGTNASGNVGIGTNSPTVALQVEDTDYHQIYAKGQSTVGGIRLGNSVYDNGFIYYDNGANMLFNTNNAERMRIDSAGIVTMPNQPAFKAFRTTGNFTHTSGFLLIPINSTAASGAGFNTGNNYSTSNQRFTAPVSGAYNFSGSVNYYGVSSGYVFAASIWVNSSSTKGFFGDRSYSGGGGDIVSSVSGNLYLSAGDYVDLRGYTDDPSGGGSGSTAGNWNYFTGHLIG